MTQQVNLYTDDFKPVKVVLPLEQIVILSLVVIAILVASTLVLNANVAEKREDIEARQAKVDDLQATVSKLEKEVNLRKKDESLVRANERLTEKLRAREDMVDILDSLVIQGDEGFSNLLVSLSRQTIESLWLTRIEISGAGENVALTGTTYAAESVPAYLQKLRDEPGFIGRSFTLFELTTDEENKGKIGFQLRSEVDGESSALNLVNTSTTSDVGLEGGEE